MGELRNGKIVLVDMDGVIADFEQGFQKAVNEKFPHLKLIPLEERTVFYTNLQYAQLYPLYSKEFHRLTRQPGFFKKLPLIPGAKEALKILSQNYNVFLCTSPMRAYDNCVVEKYEWVEKHFGFEWTKKLILTRDKTLVQAAVLIDDKPQIDGCLEPKWKHVMFDQPYNASSYAEFRLRSWANIADLVEYIDALPNL